MSTIDMTSVITSGIISGVITSGVSLFTLNKLNKFNKEENEKKFNRDKQLIDKKTENDNKNFKRELIEKRKIEILDEHHKLVNSSINRFLAFIMNDYKSLNNVHPHELRYHYNNEEKKHDYETKEDYRVIENFVWHTNDIVNEYKIMVQHFILNNLYIDTNNETIFKKFDSKNKSLIMGFYEDQRVLINSLSQYSSDKKLSMLNTFIKKYQDYIKEEKLDAELSKYLRNVKNEFKKNT